MELRVDHQAFVVVFFKGFLRHAPGGDLADFGVGEEPQDGDVLTAPTGDFAAPAVHACPAQLAIVARAQPAGGFLDFADGPL